MSRKSRVMGILMVVVMVTGGTLAGGMLLPSAIRAISWAAISDVPSAVNHQGTVTVNGVRFTGTAAFRFAMVDPDTGNNVWTNDGTELGTSGIPTDAVSLSVADGIYSVRLGDVLLAHMTAIPPSLFADGNLKLRIWFDDGTNGNQQLSPDHTLSSVPYAMSVADGAVSTGKLANGAVTSAKLDAGVAATIVPVGTVVATAATSPATGWLLCDGSAVSRTTYATLFAAVGTSYGSGDGSTTFNLPDLRGRVVMGTGTGLGGGASGSGAPAGGSALTARSLGAWGGEERHTLTVAEMPAHKHGVNLEFGTTTVNSGAGSNYSQVQGTGGYYGPFTAPISNTGGGGSHNIIQPFAALNYIIKF